MRGVFVDIENELNEIAREADLLAAAIELYRHDAATADRARAWLDVQGLASATEKIYTGCERVMVMIAREIDGAPVDHAEGWHSTLLRRLANPYPGIREAVISGECRDALDRLRSFRHRERNSYGLALDPEIVRERATEACKAFAHFRAEIAAFAGLPGTRGA